MRDRHFCIGGFIHVGMSVGNFIDFTVSVFMMHLLSLPESGQYVDMVKTGIMDPLKVIRTALVDAAR